jgi:cytochrome d ubiquinol oxidase subunit II
MIMEIDLNFVWFMILGGLLSGYAILDGFDLGVGSLHLLTKKDEHRRILLNSIGPVWDGNEVWLVTGGGAMFAAFPKVYATVFSGFYIPFMLLLFGLIFRAVAIEFRSKEPSEKWRRTWDVAFSVASTFVAFLMGVALGNIIRGIPLDPNGEFTAGFITLMNPYALLVGVGTVALFMMHGAIYAAMKTEGELQNQVRGWINNTIIFFMVCFATMTTATLVYIPHMSQPFRDNPILFLLAIVTILAVANIPREIHHGRDFRAFLSSSFAVAALLGLVAVGIFPNLVLSTPNPEYSLTIYNGSSSQKTLNIMLIIAFIGMPFVVAYTTSVYWIFRGKVKLDASSY